MEGSFNGVCNFHEKSIPKLQRRIDAGLLSPDIMEFRDEQLGRVLRPLRVANSVKCVYWGPGAFNFNSNLLLAKEVPHSYYQSIVNWTYPRSALDQFIANDLVIMNKFANVDLEQRWVEFSDHLIARNNEGELRNCVTVEKALAITKENLVALFACDISFGNDQAGIEHLLTHFPRTIRALYGIITSPACIHDTYHITQRTNFVGVCDLGRLLLSHLAAPIDETYTYIDRRIDDAIDRWTLSNGYGFELPGENLYRFNEASIKKFLDSSQARLHDNQYAAVGV